MGLVAESVFFCILGQPLSIAYDSALRRSAKDKSLLKRIEKPPLLNRLSQDQDEPRKKTGREQYVLLASS